MLTPGQEKYLSTMDSERICKISPFDPEVLRTGQEIENNLNTILPKESIVIYIGSSVLGIAGENDIDISVVSKDGEFQNNFKVMKLHYGVPKEEKAEKEYVKWEFKMDGFPVELYLNGKMTSLLQEQINTHKILTNDENLRKEYESIKIGFDGKSWKDYMRVKMEFFNRISN